MLLIGTIAIVSGVVLAIAAGARRTDTVADRFSAAWGGDVDAMVIQQDGGPPVTDQLRGLPGVESADALTFVFAGLVPGGSDAPVDALPFIGTVAAVRGRLLAGRAPDPTRAGEFVATPSFIASAGASIGDTFRLVSLSQEEAFEHGFDSPTRSGPTMTAELVGIVESVSQIRDPTPMVIFSDALFGVEGEGGRIGLALSNIAVELDDGVDLADLRLQLDGLPDSASLGISSGDLIDGDLRQALSTQAVGLWLLAGVAAAAAVVVLGQIILRAAQVSEAERERLIQIGATTGSVLAESCGRAVVPIAVGCTLGIAVAVVPAGIFPTGFAGRYEPDVGIRFDASTLVLGSLLLMVVLAVWTGVALRHESRPRVTITRPSSIEAIAARSPSSVASTGLRFAFGRRPTGRSGTTGVVLAIATTVALLVGALVFGFSLNRLIDEPFRYGVGYDFAAGNDGSEAVPSELIGVISETPGITSAILYSTDHARRNDTDVELLGMQHVRGSGAPMVTAGTLPFSSEEIVLGRTTARELGVSVGDPIELTGVTGTATFRVTGLAVIPGFGANEGVGRGAMLTMEGLVRLDRAAQPNVVAVRFESGPDADDALRKVAVAAGSDPRELPFRPAVIVNLGRIRNIPFVLALLIGALSLLTVVNIVVSSVRYRRREFAILRSLGAGGGWIGRAMHWQASLLLIVPAMIGAGAGIALGRHVFIAFATDMGAIDDPSVPSMTIALLVLSLVLIANLAALPPGRAVRRVAPAAQLHVD